MAERIAAEGGRVAVWDLKPQAATDAAHREALDVSDADAVARAAQATNAALGRIDILVNSAGITGATAPVMDYRSTAGSGCSTSTSTACSTAAAPWFPFMLANDYGRIVNVSSVAGKEGNPNASAYSASKAAVIGLTKSLGKELATSGVCEPTL